MNSAVLVYLETTYTKIRLLRQTEKSTIWLAADRAGQLAVLKRLALTGLPLKELQEANCPLCPQIYYYAEDEGETIIVEEHIEGTSLDQLYADETMTEKEAADLLLALAQGLSLLHSKGIIHRDIKPANLLREKSGHIRLIDFDAARLMKEGADEDTTRLGTKGYAPPEQFGYGQTDGRSDIYALGMTLKKLLPPGYHGCLSPILHKCTAADPQERYQSLEELANALKHQLFFQKIKLPLAALILAATLLLLALATFEPLPEKTEPPVENTPALTEDSSMPAPANDTSETEPPKQAQEPPAPLPPTAENVPAAAPAVTPQPLPEAAPSHTPPAEPLPKAPAPVSPAPTIPMGTLRTTLFWNGKAMNETAYPPPQISPKDWLTGSASLHVENDSNTALPAATISLAYSSNYGKNLDAEALLPALSPGETADIPIPCGTAFPEGAESLAVWVQIRLPRTILPQTENYRCLNLDITQGK